MKCLAASSYALAIMKVVGLITSAAKANRPIAISPSASSLEDGAAINDRADDAALHRAAVKWRVF
jgi:hypothetical protein